MILWKQYLEDNNVDICCITETHLKDTNIGRRQNKKKKFQNTEFHKFFKDSYEVITKNRRNQRGRRGHGGIGIMIKRNIGKVREIEQKRQDGLLWTEISCGHRKIYIATDYMVPAVSP